MSNGNGMWARTGLGPGAALLLALALLLTAPIFAQDDNGPSAPTSSYQQAFLAYKGGNFQAALTAAEDAEKEMPGNVNAVILKARILTELQEFDDASKALESLNENPHLTPADHTHLTMAFGDLCLRQRDFDGAAKFYESLMTGGPADPDLVLKVIYSRVGAGDLTTALRYSSELKPLDPVNPAYYFAKAALANASGNSTESDQDIQTVRTIYGITVANHYLRTYLQVFSGGPKGGVNARAEPPATNAAPASPNQP